MNLQKRDCPIKLELLPYGYDNLHITLEIDGNVHCFLSESIIGGGFAEFMHSHLLLSIVKAPLFQQGHPGKLRQREG